MDKLTPTQMAGMFRELLGKLNARATPFDLVRCMVAMFEQEAARREGEQKPQGDGWETVVDPETGRSLRVPPTEREGLGSAAAGCRAAKDGECIWAKCPQEKDGRRNYQASCPLLGSAAAKQRVENQDEIASLLEMPVASVDGHSTDAEIAEVADAMRADLAAPLRLEVGKSYARRDGTGPVKIVADDRDVWPMRGDDGHNYTRGGFFRTSYNIDPLDLVALWQPEAQAPQTDAGDLVQRLRSVNAETSPYANEVVRPWCNEAADRIEAQAREIAWLTRNLSKCDQMLAGSMKSSDLFQNERDALKARVAELESNLEATARDWDAEVTRANAINSAWHLLNAALTGDKTNG